MTARERRALEALEDLERLALVAQAFSRMPELTAHEQRERLVRRMQGAVRALSYAWGV